MEVFVSKCVAIVLTMLMGLGVAGRVAAQRPDPAYVKELARIALQQSQARAQNPNEANAGPTVDLTVDDAVQRALDKNLDIAVNRLSPRTYDYSIASIRAAYHPTINSSVNNQSAVTLPTSQFGGGAVVATTTRAWSAGVSQGVQWGGGSFNVNFTNNRRNSDAANNIFNPAYSSSLNISYTQPLLRNFRIDSTRTSLQTAQISQDISELSLKSTIATTVATVRNAYWDLLAANRAVDVARQSLALASKLVADNRQRVEIGTMAPLDVVQAQAEEATRRQTLVQAESTRRTAELTLKQLLVSGTDDELWRSTINPVDQPAISPMPIDIESAIGQALQNRLDLAQARRQLESNDLSLRNLTNLTMPSLDLVGTYQLAGRGGTSLQYSSSIGGQVINRIPGGYGDALANIGHLDAPTWNVQLNMSYPLGVSSAKANLARARIQLEQTQAQIKQLELQIAAEVTNIALQVRSNAQQIETSGAARELAQQRLDAEQSKFEVGLSTNYQVVQAQRDLVDAQIAELRANLNYQKSLVDFERVQTTGSARSITSIGSGGGGGGQ
jgi:outer membrane protein TolC